MNSKERDIDLFDKQVVNRGQATQVLCVPCLWNAISLSLRIILIKQDN